MKLTARNLLTMEIIFKHGWVLFIVVTFINAFIMLRRTKSSVELNPDLKEGYNKLFKFFLIYMNIPWLIMGIGAGQTHLK